jgi:hypothetical protein
VDFLVDPQQDDLEPVRIAHADAVRARVAVALVAHLLAGEPLFGAVQIGWVADPQEDTRHPGLVQAPRGFCADLPDNQRVGGLDRAVQYGERAVVPFNLQRKHVTVERQ